MDELVTDLKYNKQLIVEFKHIHTEKRCLVIIATIDSLMYNLTSCNTRSSDFFNDLLTDIIENGCNKVNKDGGFKFAGRDLKLNKKCELWVDEAQDLGIKYVDAIMELMLSTKIDVVVVGDKLQSLEHEENFMTIKKTPPNINLIIDDPININRRIKVKHMSKKINELVEYKKYGLSEISLENEEKLEDHGENILECIDEPVIYANDQTSENIKKINEYINIILECIDNEVQKHNYSPNDFLIIFPIMSGNLLACELETKIYEYWINELNDDKYEQYAVLHRHQEGQIIDTNLSKNATRIMSIRSSKGDGRKVVFILGCNERSLKLCSRGEINLIYESHFDVALTRAEYKIYFGLQKNGDDIHRRFGSIGDVEYKPSIKISFRINKLLEYIDTEKMINILKNNGITDMGEDSNNKKNESEMIDWDYHCIRRSIYYQYAIFSILERNENNNNFKGSQIRKVLNNISELSIVPKTPKQFYECLNSLGEFDNLKYFPLCNISHKKTVYRKFFKKIGKIMVKIQKDYKNNNFSLANQNPLEAVIQNYMIEIEKHKKYHETTPSTIYNIIDYFENEDETKETKLLKEAENIKGITGKVMNEILRDNNDIEWNIEHMIKLKGNTGSLKILKPDYPIIGRDHDNVYHIVMKTDFNKLNYWETLIEILMERFLIYNPSDKGKDIDKFAGKNIKTYLFILKKNDYKLFDWEWDKNLTLEIKQEVKNAIIKYLSDYNKEIFQYYNFIKNKKEYWKSFGTPLEYIKNEFEDVEYIKEFFSELTIRTRKSKEGKDEVKKLTNDYNKFNGELTNKIETMCDLFFGLNINDTDEEW